MKNGWLMGIVAMAALALAGCASVTVQTHAYLGVPNYPPTTPAQVQIVTQQPKQPHERLGEIILSGEGNPSRDTLEKKLKEEAAKLGANAVVIIYDKTHVFPIVYVDWYWGPSGVSEEMHREVVGMAIRYK